jgi:hypothetical protein
MIRAYCREISKEKVTVWSKMANKAAANLRKFARILSAEEQKRLLKS